MPINSDSNSTDQFDNTKVVITGSDNAVIADVVQTNGHNRLLVDSEVTPKALGQRQFLFAKNGGSPDMNVDGSTTPFEFTITADATEDFAVEALRFFATDSGIKIDKFLGENNPLTNGINVEIKSDDTIFTFPTITNTIEFHAFFALSRGEEFSLVFASGQDSMVATFFPSERFIIRKQGTFGTDDYIKVTINDDIDTVSSLHFFASTIKTGA